MGQSLNWFRACAAECVEAAHKTNDVEAASTLLLMAQRWLELADEQPAPVKLVTELADEQSAAPSLEAWLAEFNRKQMSGP
jgi:outer membrane cobalamin receptor